MPDDVFRIVVAAGVVLASIAVVVQTGIVFALYFGVRKTREKVEGLVDRAAPVVEKAGPLLDRVGPVLDGVGPVIERVGPILGQGQRVLASAAGILEDSRPRIAEISNNAAAIAKSGREQVEKLGNLLHDASERAHTRLEQIDQSVESTVEQVIKAGDAMKRTAMRPVREVNGLAAGISAAVTTFVRGPRKSHVDEATQDEEMFI
jgi:hypothetical protein